MIDQFLVGFVSLVLFMVNGPVLINNHKEHEEHQVYRSGDDQSLARFVTFVLFVVSVPLLITNHKKHEEHQVYRSDYRSIPGWLCVIGALHGEWSGFDK